MIERGKIRNREFAKQLKDFSGLKYGSITPTDIDGFLDFGNKIFIIIEIKYGNSRLLYGQKLALERLCDNLQKSGKQTYLIIGKHNAIEDIDVANCTVVKYRHMEKWMFPKRKITIKSAIDILLKINKMEYF